MKKKKVKKILNILHDVYHIECKYCLEQESEYFMLVYHGHVSILSTTHPDIIDENACNTARWLFKKSIISP